MSLKYTAPIYEDHIEPNGRLPRAHAAAASAAWHFAKLAMKALEDIPEQVTLEGDVDRTISLRRLAESVAVMYGIHDLNDWLKFMPACREEAFVCGFYWNPRLQAWLDNAGGSWDTMTREPDALGKDKGTVN